MSWFTKTKTPWYNRLLGVLALWDSDRYLWDDPVVTWDQISTNGAAGDWQTPNSGSWFTKN